MKTERLPETGSQTAGPFVHIGLAPALAGIAVCAGAIGARIEAAAGQRIVVEGAIVDGAGEAVTDALVELWQADAAGRYDAVDFRGYARSGCVDGRWRFETIMPGPVPGRDGGAQAPHLNLWIVARGINRGLHTRVYFDGEPANGGDAVLAAVDPVRRPTLLAMRAGERDGVPVWRLNIALQGERETVFFDI